MITRRKPHPLSAARTPGPSSKAARQRVAGSHPRRAVHDGRAGAVRADGHRWPDADAVRACHAGPDRGLYGGVGSDRSPAAPDQFHAACSSGADHHCDRRFRLGAGPHLLPTGIATVMGPAAPWAFGIALLMPGTTTSALASFASIAGAASALTGFLQVGGGLASTAVAALVFRDPFLVLTIVM